jgi:hypothetical protein
MGTSWLLVAGVRRLPERRMEEVGEVSAKWKTVNKSSGHPASPETPEQVDWVKTWPHRRKVCKSSCFATVTMAHCWGWPLVTH